jgi:hypothetical protein
MPALCHAEAGSRTRRRARPGLERRARAQSDARAARQRDARRDGRSGGDRLGIRGRTQPSGARCAAAHGAGTSPRGAFAGLCHEPREALTPTRRPCRHREQRAGCTPARHAALLGRSGGVPRHGRDPRQPARCWAGGCHRAARRPCARQTSRRHAPNDHRAPRARPCGGGQRGGAARPCGAASRLARVCDPSYRRGGGAAPGGRGVAARVPDGARLRAVARALPVADAVVFAARTSRRWAARSVAHRAARVRVEAMRCPAQSADNRRDAHRHLSGAARSADGEADHGDDAVGFSRCDAVAPQDRRQTS